MNAAKKKPKLFLLDGKRASDVNELAKLYEAITGKKPTPQEMEEVKKILDE
jgi:hypothetical protein